MVPGMSVGAWLRELRAIRAQRDHHRSAPPNAGLVVDVGGGDKPHPRADIVVDKYVADNFERESGIALEKPIVVADGEHLPFADDAFAYVIASHVLEHAIDPVRFASELSRIGEAGFVQVPSRLAELTFGWPFHPWLVEMEDGVLVFRARGDSAAPAGDFFHGMYQESPLMRAWFEAHRSAWHHSVHWRGSLDVRVEGQGQAPQTAEFDIERSASLLEEAHRQGRVAPLTAELRALLRCPACGGALEVRAERAVCGGCAREFRVAGQVPLLLDEALLPA
jgi:uncharacterized protein YbaR (Trm112 family)